MEDLILRILPASLWLAILWCAESFVNPHATGRVRHAFVNLSLACINGVLLFVPFSALSVWVCTVSPSIASGEPGFLHAATCFLALDLFSYVWHRLNHAIPFLWRIHSVHHSDAQMDVTSAGRFHVLELAIGAVLRLPLLYALGVSTVTLLAYETTLVIVSMFHHSRLSLGQYDRYVRLLSVSPLMHSIHHSIDPLDYDSNYSSVFSIWDRMFLTLRLTDRTITHGLDDAETDSVRSLVQRPFVKKADHDR